MSVERQYWLASSRASHAFVASLAERFVVREEKPSRVVRTYLDTFDWKLHRSEAVLVGEAVGPRTTLTLRSAASDRVVRCRVDAVPGFGEELPRGPLRDFVRPRSGIRRLLPMARVNAVSRLFRVLDGRRKTVVRVRLEQRSIGSRPAMTLPERVRVEPVKGYVKELRSVVGAIESLGGVEPCTAGEMAEALETLGRRPGDYSSKIRVDLVAEAPATREVRRILLALLDTLEANEDGLRRDLDIEFLHDFRVSVRRTRTALSQIKGVFDRGSLDEFKPEFAWLGKLTGPTRDLDVYLLKMKDYQQSLPAHVRRDLEPLLSFLAQRREAERDTLLAGLDSARFRSLVRRWRTFLEQPPDADAGDTPVLEVANREISRAYRRLVKRGRKIGPETPAAALHRLRIDGKKLRYLLEFFRSLYDQQEMGDLIGALKRLQDNLGDFNDYGVQQRMLSAFGEQMVEDGSGSAPVLMTMGRLLDNLESGERSERSSFGQRFSEFDSPENRRRYEHLFGAEAM